MLRSSFIPAELLCLFIAVSLPFSVSASVAAQASPEDAIFEPGTIPLDKSGNEVHAHGGGLYRAEEEGLWYWYGTTRKEQPGWTSRGINLYSSADLQRWEFQGQIFDDSQIQDVGFEHPYRIERPKVLYSRSSKEFTMLFHLDTPSFALTSVGVAKADDIRGPWRWKGAFKPDGQDSYDMTAWQDSRGDAYLARSVENSFLGVSRLNDYFNDTTGICAASSQAEAPAVFQPAGSRYNIIASHLTGWAANPPQMFASEGKSLCEGDLHPVDVPAQGPGSETTFNSQPTYVFPLDSSEGDILFIYMGDRWNFYGPGSVGAASYVWLPLIPCHSGSFELLFLPKWSPKDVRGLACTDRGLRPRREVVSKWWRKFTNLVGGLWIGEHFCIGRSLRLLWKH